MPNIVDHQTMSNTGVDQFTATENIATAYNLVFISVTCSWQTNQLHDPPCSATTVPTDQNGIQFTRIDRHFNTPAGWTQEDWFAIIPTTGSDVITFSTFYKCNGCTFNAMVEQIQGIEADD